MEIDFWKTFKAVLQTLYQLLHVCLNNLYPLQHLSLTSIERQSPALQTLLACM